MHTSVTEIAPNIFRLTIAPNDFFEFSQFLLVDESTCLVHAGKSSLFNELESLIHEVLGKRNLDYIVFSHVEADESGATNKWLKKYPNAQVVCNKIANISLDNFLIRPAKVLKDKEFINLGSMTLRMVETPHFPHNWDAHMWYEEKEQVLFSSDFCCQGGISQPVSNKDISGSIISFYEKGNFIPYGSTTKSNLKKLEQIPFKAIAPMHGSIIGEEVAKIVFDKVKRDLESRA